MVSISDALQTDSESKSSSWGSGNARTAFTNSSSFNGSSSIWASPAQPPILVIQVSVWKEIRIASELSKLFAANFQHGRIEGSMKRWSRYCSAVAHRTGFVIPNNRSAHDKNVFCLPEEHKVARSYYMEHPSFEDSCNCSQSVLVQYQSNHIPRSQYLACELFFCFANRSDMIVAILNMGNTS